LAAIMATFVVKSPCDDKRGLSKEGMTSSGTSKIFNVPSI